MYIHISFVSVCVYIYMCICMYIYICIIVHVCIHVILYNILYINIYIYATLKMVHTSWNVCFPVHVSSSLGPQRNRSESWFHAAPGKSCRKSGWASFFYGHWKRKNHRKNQQNLVATRLPFFLDTHRRIDGKKMTIVPNGPAEMSENAHRLPFSLGLPGLPLLHFLAPNATLMPRLKLQLHLFCSFFGASLYWPVNSSFEGSIPRGDVVQKYGYWKKHHCFIMALW